MEGHFACEQDVEDDAERPDVRRPAEMLLLLRHLRTHVYGCAARGWQFRVRYGLNAGCKAEVDQLRLLRLTTIQNILKLKVSVYNSLIVHIFDRFDDLPEDDLHFIFISDARFWHFANVLVKIIAINVLQHQVDPVACVN